jgi:uncharacterized protein YkwD
VKRLSLIIALAAVAVLVVGPAASAHAATLTKPEKQLLALVNHTRAKHHMHKLTAIACLERASRAHSRDMLNHDFFSHSSSSGESFSARLIRFGFGHSGCTSWSIGEDIAYGCGPGASPKAIFNAWMHSPAHRAVILTRRFRRVGMGRAEGTVKGVSGVVFFTLDCGVRTH